MIGAQWLAGFLDADGSFSISVQRSKKDRRLKSTVCCVSVSQADPRAWILSEFQRKYGGSIHSHGKKKNTHNQAYIWSVTGKSAVAVCLDVMPYLLLKRRQAAIILEHQQSKLGTVVGCRAGISPAASRIDDATIRLRENHVLEIRTLNKRGTSAKDLSCQLAI